MTNAWLAFGLTVFAGLATGVGSAIAFFAKRTNYRFLSVSTGFSAGVNAVYLLFYLGMGSAGYVRWQYGTFLSSWGHVIFRASGWRRVTGGKTIIDETGYGRDLLKTSA